MLSDETIAELEAKHGECVVFHGRGDPPPWSIMIRVPTRGEVKLFRANANNPARGSDAQENLIRAIAVYPDKAGLDVVLSRWGFAADAICKDERFNDFVGFSTEQGGK
jgi:hypothetical protein